MMTQSPRGRINDSFVQPLERPTLAWLAARMPPWVTSDRLTCFGIFGAMLTGVSYALTNWHAGFFFLASLGIAINWFGDSLDGTLARFRKLERPRYGYLLDHSVDMYNEFFIILGLGLTAFVRFENACLVMIAYLMVSNFAFIRANVINTMQITMGRIGPTEMRLLLIVLNLLMFLLPPWTVVTLWAPMTLLDVGILVAFSIAFVALAIMIYVNAQKLGAEDPPPRR